MPAEKITLSQLKPFRFNSTDIFRGKLAVSEFKDFIVGMLFLKRLSDEIDSKREELRINNIAHIKEKPDIVNNLPQMRHLIAKTAPMLGLRAGKKRFTAFLEGEIWNHQ